MMQIEIRDIYIFGMSITSAHAPIVNNTAQAPNSSLGKLKVSTRNDKHGEL